MKDDKAKDCPAAEILYAHVDGLLDTDKDDACRRHLSLCPRCSAVVRDARGSQNLIDIIRASAPSEDERQVIETGREHLRRSLHESADRAKRR